MKVPRLAEQITDERIREYFTKKGYDPYFLEGIKKHYSGYKFDPSSGFFIKPLDLDDVSSDLRNSFNRSNPSKHLTEGDSQAKVSVIITRPTDLYSHNNIEEHLMVTFGEGFLIQMDCESTYNKALYTPELIDSKRLLNFPAGSIQSFGPTKKNDYLIIELASDGKLISENGKIIEPFHNMSFWHYLYSGK